MRLAEQRSKRLVIGGIEPVNALERRADGKRLAVDLVGLRDDTGNGAEPSDHTHRLRIGVMGQPIAEQNRIELVRLAVDVEIGPREMGIEQGGAEPGHEGEQLLHIGILGAAERERLEPRRRGGSMPWDRPGRYGGS